MNFDFADEDLKRLFCDPDCKSRWSREIVKAFRKRIQFIKVAIDERDFYGMKSLHFEKLEGKRSHQKSMRLNDQVRLVMHVKTENEKKTIIIDSIEDYH